MIIDSEIDTTEVLYHRDEIGSTELPVGIIPMGRAALSSQTGRANPWIKIIFL